MLSFFYALLNNKAKTYFNLDFGLDVQYDVTFSSREPSSDPDSEPVAKRMKLDDEDPTSYK